MERSKYTAGKVVLMRRTSVLALSVLVAAALAVAVMVLAAKPFPTARLTRGALGFRPDRAMDLTRTLASGFPSRADGQPEAGMAASWIRDEFLALGLETQVQSYEALIGGRWVTSQNIIGVKRGRSAETVVVSGHYDIPPFVSEGAADDASAVGAVLELARVFAIEATPARTLVFLASGTEEYGMVGAREFIKDNPTGGPLVAAVNLDFLNMGEMAGIGIRYTGTHRGYTPPWLRALARGAAAQQAPVYEVNAAEEWVERSVAVSLTEAGIFLENGIPAVNLTGIPVENAAQRDLYHTPGDRAANLRVDSMAKWGMAVERLIRSLSELPAIPAESMSYFTIPGGDPKYVPDWAVMLAQLLAFTPLVVGLVSGLASGRRPEGGVMEWLRGPATRLWRRWLIPAGAGLVSFGLLKALPALGALPQYQVYPATQKDPALYDPSWWPYLLVAIAFLAAFILLVQVVPFRRSSSGMGLRPVRPAKEWEGRRLAALALLGMVAVVTILEGAGFAAVLFLLPLALLWLFLELPDGPAAIIFNLAVMLVSAAPFFVLAYLFSRMYFVGPIWNYLLLSAALGLFSIKAVLAFLATAALFFTTFVIACVPVEAGAPAYAVHEKLPYRPSSGGRRTASEA